MSNKNICIDCELRHQEIENNSKLLNDLHRAIIGDVQNPEELGLCTKINLLYKEFESRKNLTKGILISSISSILIFTFWFGYQYHVLTLHTDQIHKLEIQVNKVQNSIITLERNTP